MIERESTVLFFRDLHKTLRTLSDEDAGILMKALFAHANKTEPEGLEKSPIAAALYIGISDQIDRLEEYRNKKAMNRTNRNKPEQTGTNENKQERNGSPYPYPDPVPSPDPYPSSSPKGSEGKKERELKLPKEAALPQELDQDFVREAFNDFREMRRKMRKPLTVKAEELIIKDLAKLAKGDAVKATKILEQSIKKGWQGVFPLKDEPEQDSFEKRMAAL